MRYERFVAAVVPFALAAYAVVGFSRIRGTDWIPFSAWALFVFVPNEVHSYTVHLLEVDGRTLPAPVEYSRADGLVPDAHSIQSYYLINHFAMARAKGDSAEAFRFRSLFETNGLKAQKGATRYALMRNQYDPLERWKNGAIRQMELARFTVTPSAGSAAIAPPQTPSQERP
jgi:hypothetical protein